MSYEYLIKTQNKISFLEKLRQNLVNERDVAVCDSDNNGFSVFFAENKNNEVVKKWGGDFYFLDTSNGLLLVINSDHSRAMKLINSVIQRESFSVEMDEL